MYALLVIEENISVESNWPMLRETTMPLRWAEGMCGVVPVFETPEAAQAYADEHGYRAEIVALALVKDL